MTKDLPLIIWFSELDRIRWHCRRGMLELDIVLQEFVPMKNLKKP